MFAGSLACAEPKWHFQKVLRHAASKSSGKSKSVEIFHFEEDDGLLFAFLRKTALPKDRVGQSFLGSEFESFEERLFVGSAHPAEVVGCEVLHQKRSPGAEIQTPVSSQNIARYAMAKGFTNIAKTKIARAIVQMMSILSSCVMVVSRVKKAGSLAGCVAVAADAQSEIVLVVFWSFQLAKRLDVRCERLDELVCFGFEVVPGDQVDSFAILSVTELRPKDRPLLFEVAAKAFQIVINVIGHTLCIKVLMLWRLWMHAVIKKIACCGRLFDYY